MPKKDDERTPQEWREFLATARYPEEVTTGRRRGRRQRKREHREAVRRNTREWVREERRRDPIRPAGAVIILAVILGLGVGARWLWPGLLGAERDGAAQVTNSASPTPGAQDDKPAASSSAASSPSSSPSESAPAVDLSDPETVAEEAVRLYLTRNPPQDEEHTAPVLRAAPYMAPSLVENLTSHSDPAWDKLVSRGGVSSVSSVKVAPAKNDLPADSPIRVWRETTAKVDVEGYTNYSETVVYQVELTNSSGDGWHVSRILGL
ncbi:hypothetical protein OVA19_00025 [Streptomyces sp. SL203]|nr:hypothetical protein [Streptomyces sp. SL203]MCY1649208.1 hypothetical protein [Streptomyces sp. SL203]